MKKGSDLFGSCDLRLDLGHSSLLAGVRGGKLACALFSSRDLPI